MSLMSIAVHVSDASTSPPPSSVFPIFFKCYFILIDRSSSRAAIKVYGTPPNIKEKAAYVEDLIIT